MSDTKQTDQSPERGTIRLLLALHVAEPNTGPGSLNAAVVLAYEGGPRDAGFALGDDLTMGEGYFADSETPAQFHDTDHLTTGLWLCEWDWAIVYNEDDDETDHAYGKERWSRPSLADLTAFGLLPEPAHV